MNAPLKRNYAVKVLIKDIIEGSFQKNEENQSSYILTSQGLKIFQVNIMGAVLNIEKQGSITNISIDDGTGRIIVRLFEENKNLHDIFIGSSVFLIGKVRVFNNEIYISPDIIKSISVAWLKVRALELGKKILDTNKMKNPEIEPIVVNPEITSIQKAPSSKINEEVGTETQLEEVFSQKKEGEQVLPFQKILDVVKNLDTGDGALIEEVIEKSSINNTEEFIQKMLEKGEIFQLTPGKIKVL